MIICGAVGRLAKDINMSSSKIALFLSLIGLIFLLVIFIGKKQALSWSIIKKNAFPLIIASIALSGNWIFLFQAYKETTIANAALSYYFAPVLVTVFSPLVLKEKLSLKKVICVFVALLGLFFILENSTFETSGNHLLGIGYGLVAASFYASLTFANKFIRGLDGMTNTIMQLGLSVVILFLFLLLTDGFDFSALGGNTVILMLILGIIHGGIGFYLFFTGMNGLKAQSIAVLSYVDPLTSLLISALLMGENMTLLQLTGASLLLGSIGVSETAISKSKINLKRTSFLKFL